MFCPTNLFLSDSKNGFKISNFGNVYADINLEKRVSKTCYIWNIELQSGKNRVIRRIFSHFKINKMYNSKFNDNLIYKLQFDDSEITKSYDNKKKLYKANISLNNNSIPIIIVTHDTKASSLMTALKKIEKQDFVLEKIILINIDNK